jgi:starch-binding outer membrane protein, SusD/RagB family
LLIHAEALGQYVGATEEAYASIDAVRVRAGLEKLADISPGLSKEDFREAVYEERRKEFVYEYQRWFDLARRGPEYYVAKLHASGKTTAAPRHVHFPTPQREIDINPKLEQHPDWITF